MISYSLDVFKCHCKRPECDAPEMDPAFMVKFNKFCEELGYCPPVSSASRCEYWNAQVKGRPKSFHRFGKALDLGFKNLVEGRVIQVVAERVGFGGVEISTRGMFVHIDTGPKRQWVYK